jgi:dihydropteroate synthase
MTHTWHIRERILTLTGQPLVMGIVNVTPDSFSDGGQFASADAAVAHGLRLVDEGADLLDVGGESTRPGAAPVPADEELARVLPVVEGLARRTTVPLSVDTSKAAVARHCLDAGAHVINDVTALAGDPDMAALLAARPAGVVLMHMQGTPQTMQLAPSYRDVVADVGHFLQQRLTELAAAGIAAERVVLDPGIGFGKTAAHNLALLARLEELQRFGRPVLLGVSRKGFLGKFLGRPPEQRLAGSLAALLAPQSRGAVQIVRVHDVAATRDAVTLFSLIDDARRRGGKSVP